MSYRKAAIADYKEHVVLRINRLPTIFLLLAASQATYAFDWKQGHFVGDLGWYRGSQGESQHINIATLIGDNFSVTKNNDSNYLLGLGYMLDGGRHHNIDFGYGVHAYYFGEAKVSGYVTQENLFTNLSYQYFVNHLPIYFTGNGLLPTAYPGLSVSVGVGIGPNFISAFRFSESSLDSGVTIPEDMFSNETSVVASGMLGLGLRYMYRHKYPIELGWRFFWLGRTSMNPRISGVSNHLSTGDVYANALTLTLGTS